MSKDVARQALRSFFRAVAAGGRPRDGDLEATGIPREHWLVVHRTADRILQLREEGSFGDARREAAEASERLLGELGPTWRPPDPEEDDWDPSDPEELNRRVPR